MEWQITDVTVTQQMGNHLDVQTATTADVTQGPDATGIIVNLPFANHNGGPQTGPHPVANFYKITGYVGTELHTYRDLRYLFLTPGGNAQYTTE